MEVRNLLDIHERGELYNWYLDNHADVTDFWIRVNRAEKPFPGVIGYIDAVEVALCFGWIDSTQKRIDEGKPIQHFTPRRKGCNWCWQNVERCYRLIESGEMQPSGFSAMPLWRPEDFVFQDWVIDALKADRAAWSNFLAFPDVYKRIKIDRIQHYMDTGRPEEARRALMKFVADTADGKLQSNWNDGGRLG